MFSAKFLAPALRVIGLLIVAVPAQNSAKPCSVPCYPLRLSTLHVRSDGTGDCSTIQAAIDCVPEGYFDTHFTISVAPGFYWEKLRVGPDKGPITLVGMSDRDDGIVIAFNDADRPPNTGSSGCRGNAGGHWDSQTLLVASDDFILANVTVLNSACQYRSGRNFAVQFVGDRISAFNVRIYGTADTFFTGRHRLFVSRSWINGTGDFLFGLGSSVWDECTIVSESSQGVITAHRAALADANGQTACQPHGNCSAYLIKNSKLLAPHGLTRNGTHFLGRPWHSRATVVFENVWMDRHISPRGWDPWQTQCKFSDTVCANVTYAEFNSSGPGADPSGTKRVAWSRQLTAEELAEKWTLRKVLKGWVPPAAPQLLDVRFVRGPAHSELAFV